MATANAPATSGAVAAAVEASAAAGGGIGGASSSSAGLPEEVEAKKAQKRYEGLVVVRSKAIRGKGAWYWSHLEPILVPNPDTGVPKAVKLRCSLCDAMFSASNPSRTASEHLKRGTCPNFSTSPSTAEAAAAAQGGTHTPLLRPISTIHPCPSPTSSHQHRQQHQQPTNRKRPQPTPPPPSPSVQISPLAIVDASRFSSPTGTDFVHSSSATPPASHLHHHQPAHLMTAGGKEDLGALALLEDSVKRLKSPKASPGPALGKDQVESAVSLLSDWVYESSGAVSFSSVEHPKFRAFLQQVGLPPVSRRELAGARLDARYEEVRSESEARIRDALFFQVASDGWKSTAAYPGSKEDGLINLTVNLPNGTSVFRKAVFTNGKVPPKYAEDIFWDTIVGVGGGGGGGGVRRCAGIVADRFKSTALRDLESRNHWMVNLPCQLQCFYGLIKDFARDLPLFHSVVAGCAKLAYFFNTNSQARAVFHKHQLREHDHAGLLRLAPCVVATSTSVQGAADYWDRGSVFGGGVRDLASVVAMLEDIVGFGHALQMAVLDDAYKLSCAEDTAAREMGEMIHEEAFWNNLGAVLSLVKVVRSMAEDMEAERPLVGQCLPLWEELRAKVKEWCAKFNADHVPVERLVERRFRRNYHPAWSAAFILDPLYLARDTSGKYLPQFKCLTPEQEKDVDKLITRLVSREEAHITLMELMKWRTEGLDPLYAQAVQVRQRDPATGKMRFANPPGRRLVWETCLSEFRSLGKVAARLIFLHATSRGFKSNWSLLRWVRTHGRSRAGVDRAQKLVFVAANAKLDRRDFSNEEEKDAELFANEEDDVLNDHPPFADGSAA